MSKHRVLIIGGGSIGERHLRCFLRTGEADVSLCEINPELRARLASTYTLSGSFGDLNEALAARPEVAVICTPAHLHIAQGIQCAQAGAHLLIEKPLSTSLDRIDDLLAVVAERQRIAGVAYVLRCHPMLAAMRDAWQRGDFGRPLHVTVSSGQHFPLYRPAYRNIYYTNRATGGGAIQDALTHLVNAVEWTVGPVSAVAADAQHLWLEGVTVEDTVNLIARHGSVMATYGLNQFQAPNETSITIAGEQGTTRYEAHNSRWVAAREPGAAWEVQASCTLERDDMFVEQARRTLQAVAGSGPVTCTLAEARQTLRVNLAVLEAADHQRWVTLA
ncbi:MAG: Gfo/Idh/MocA family oxidoreductase [Planctomycetaceae bacterium]|nr:Gfo/Idh/MocA family oxidoreductase [Planctomycetaceae bacterium]